MSILHEQQVSDFTASINEIHSSQTSLDSRYQGTTLPRLLLTKAADIPHQVTHNNARLVMPNITLPNHVDPDFTYHHDFTALIPFPALSLALPSLSPIPISHPDQSSTTKRTTFFLPLISRTIAHPYFRAWSTSNSSSSTSPSPTLRSPSSCTPSPHSASFPPTPPSPPAS